MIARVFTFQKARKPRQAVAAHTVPPPSSLTSEDDDLTLIRRIAAQDRQAFEALYYRYTRRLAGYLGKFIKRQEIVEEVLNDVMLAVWQSAARFEGTARVSTWIFGIAHHRAMKALALSANQPTVTPPMMPAEPADSEDPERVMTRMEIGRTLTSALATLSPEQRAVVELTYYHNYSYQEIAAIIACPVNTVKTRMFHARRRLAQSFTARDVRHSQGGQETST